MSLTSLIQVSKGSRGEVDQLGKLSMKLSATLFAGKARQFQRLFPRAGKLIEKPAQLIQRLLHGTGQGPLQPLAQRHPIWLALQDNVVHPAVAAR